MGTSYWWKSFLIYTSQPEISRQRKKWRETEQQTFCFMLKREFQSLPSSYVPCPPFSFSWSSSKIPHTSLFYKSSVDFGSWACDRVAQSLPHRAEPGMMHKRSLPSYHLQQLCVQYSCTCRYSKSDIKYRHKSQLKFIFVTNHTKHTKLNLFY